MNRRVSGPWTDYHREQSVAAVVPVAPNRTGVMPL